MAQMIPLVRIERNPKQPREEFPDVYIAELARSINKRGLIQPITVRPIGKRRFMIVAGECRFRAHKLLGRATIDANVVKIDAREMQLRAIVENMQRKDMNPIEEAKGFQALLDEGYDVDSIVVELGLKSPAIVAQRLNLFNLTPEIRKLVASGQLAVTMAWGVALVSPERQAQMVRDISSGRFRTAEQVKHAAIAIRDAEAQTDAFAHLPKASPRDLAAVRGLEAKIEAIVEMVAAGFEGGECVAAQRVSADRVKIIADKLVLVRKGILRMEHDLRRVATQTEIRFEEAAE